MHRDNSSINHSNNDSEKTGHTPEVLPETEFIHIIDNSIYIELTPNTPSIGNVRITYTKASPTNKSLLARVSGNTFTNYTAKSGKSFSSISTGAKSAEEMFQTEHDTNMWSWILRLVSLLLAIGGLKAIF